MTTVDTQFAPTPSRVRLGARQSAAAMGGAHMRSQNLVAVLNSLSRLGVTSRAEIALETGLTRSTVSILVQELIDLGIIEERGILRVGRVGRPVSSLVTRTDLHWGIGLEVNVDYIAVCAVDLLGNVRYRAVVSIPLHDADPQEVLAKAGQALAECLADAERDGARPAGIGAAFPGIVELGGERVRLAPNLGWRDVPVVAELRRHLPAGAPRITLGNASNMAALAEAWFGLGAENFIRVSGDDFGIGGGLIIDGELFRGARGTAGEIGHVVVDPGGPRCACGARGCLEQFASLRSILANSGIRPESESSAGFDVAGLELIGRLKNNDQKAATAVAKAARALAVGVASVVHIVDPSTVVLGSWLARLSPWLMPELLRALSNEARATGTEAVTVHVSELDGDGAMLGAAGSVVLDIFAAPEIVASTS